MFSHDAAHMVPVSLEGGNPCQDAACSQLCVLTHPLENNGRGYRCMCEAGYQIDKDGRNCVGMFFFTCFL